MTENEAIELLNSFYEMDEMYAAAQVAIQALEEIQQCRAIGTVEELKSMKENGAFTGVELAQLAAMQMRLKEYSAIGTIEEFKALKVENEELHCEIQAFNATMELLENEIRAKAIDEFMEKVKPIIDEKIKGWTNSDDLRRWCARAVDEITEQMKAGGENE